MDSGGQVIEDIEMREAQLVLVELEKQWDSVENRTFSLMRELEAAENRLIAAFMDEWRDRGGDLKMMRLAYSHFRKRLLWAAGNRKKGRPASGFSGFPTRR
jgi:outer membrane lipopolysaccharide assembly protein LptE/RlpB